MNDHPPVPEPNQAIRRGQVKPDGLALNDANDGSLIVSVIMSDMMVGAFKSGQNAGEKSLSHYSIYPKKRFRRMIQVDDGRSSSALLTVIMTNRDSSTMHNSNEILGNHRYGCTIITNEKNIYYDCGVRLISNVQPELF